MTHIKRTVLFFLVSFISFSTFSQQHCDSIPWSENLPLKWRHFKGKPDRTYTINALSQINIYYQYTRAGHITQFHFSCFFLPCSSWVRYNPSNNLLEHEQTHFNLAEYHKRLLVEKIITGKFYRHNMDTQIDSIAKLINLQRLEMDQLYDRETNHSIDKEKQIEWSQKALNLIRQTSLYGKSTYLVTID